MGKHKTMSARTSLFIFASTIFFISCSSNAQEEKNNTSSTGEPSRNEAVVDSTANQSNAEDARFYFDFLALGFDLDSSWNRASEEKELAVKKLFYNLNHSKLAIDVVGVFENTDQQYLSISTSNIKNEWIFDEVKANEYFMNKVNRRFEGEVNGLRFVAFNIDFEGGQWVRAFIHNAPLRNFEMDIVSTDKDADLEQKIQSVIERIRQ